MQGAHKKAGLRCACGPALLRISYRHNIHPTQKRYHFAKPTVRCGGVILLVFAGTR